MKAAQTLFLLIMYECKYTYEGLHSRQLAVYGRDAIRCQASANVLISGFQGLGVEMANDVILAGAKSVTLHDQSNVERGQCSET